MGNLRSYISSLLKHGWEESWIPDLTIEQVAAIAAIANAELVEILTQDKTP